jgi:hypothetical protein
MMAALAVLFKERDIPFDYQDNRIMYVLRLCGVACRLIMCVQVLSTRYKHMLPTYCCGIHGRGSRGGKCSVCCL